MSNALRVRHLMNGRASGRQYLLPPAELMVRARRAKLDTEGVDEHFAPSVSQVSTELPIHWSSIRGAGECNRCTYCCVRADWCDAWVIWIHVPGSAVGQLAASGKRVACFNSLFGACLVLPVMHVVLGMSLQPCIAALRCASVGGAVGVIVHCSWLRMIRRRFCVHLCIRAQQEMT